MFPILLAELSQQLKKLSEIDFEEIFII